MFNHPTNDPFDDTESNHSDLDPIAPGMALIIGPSGPAWFPERRASAVNQNPNHDERGRFTDAAHAVGPAGRAHTIRGHSFGGKQSIADCVLRAAQTIVATENDQDEKQAPTLGEISAKLTTEVVRRNAVNKADVERMNANETDPAKRSLALLSSFDREHGLSAAGLSYMVIMARVLDQYGIATTADLNRDPKQRLTPKQLADKLIAKGTPAMLNVKDDGANVSSKNGHAVTVQWDPQAGDDGKGRFLVNNLNAEGGTRVFTRQEFESGTLKTFSADTRDSSGVAKTRQNIDLDFPIIYVERH